KDCRSVEECNLSGNQGRGGIRSRRSGPDRNHLGSQVAQLASRCRVTSQTAGYPSLMLATGTKLGPYEIESPLGSGGMGEVYRALDTRLDRSVAIKILPDHLSQSPEAKQRFDREARAISSLNHP